MASVVVSAMSPTVTGSQANEATRLTRLTRSSFASATRTSFNQKQRLRCSMRSAAEDSQVSVAAEKLQESDSSFSIEKLILSAAFSMAPLLDTEAAQAVDGAFGPLEGRIAAFVHPVGMGALLALTLWAGYLGWQWRRVRTIGDEISALKKTLPEAAEGAPPSPIEAEIAALTETRKALVKGGYRDQHFNAGSILLGLGVTISVGGSLNTWIRTGKLFPGPHLWAGAAITVLWALAAALVPAMQKGNENARSAHIALNAINVALFLWQVPTGLEIVGKILSLPLV